jgi:hypothetical protein
MKLRIAILCATFLASLVLLFGCGTENVKTMNNSQSVREDSGVLKIESGSYVQQKGKDSDKDEGYLNAYSVFQEQLKRQRSLF